eukprot:gene16404-biopygen21789
MGPEVGPAFLSTTVSGYRPVPSWRPFRNFRNLPRVGARDLEMPAFAPRSEPPHAHAPGAQMIRMASGRPLLNRSVTESRYDVGGTPGGGCALDVVWKVIPQGAPGSLYPLPSW